MGVITKITQIFGSTQQDKSKGQNWMTFNGKSWTKNSGIIPIILDWVNKSNGELISSLTFLPPCSRNNFRFVLFMIKIAKKFVIGVRWTRNVYRISTENGVGQSNDHLTSAGRRH